MSLEGATLRLALSFVTLNLHVMLAEAHAMLICLEAHVVLQDTSFGETCLAIGTQSLADAHVTTLLACLRPVSSLDMCLV